MTSNAKIDDERDDNVGRINALTDGVIAIAITLLALDLKPNLPKSTTSSELAHWLSDNVGQFIAFAIAFFVIAQYWVLHRRLMNRVKRVSPGLTVATLYFLFTITLAPLTASLTGDADNDLATFMFAANILLMGVTSSVMSEVIRKQQLENYQESREERVRRRSRSWIALAIPILVAALTWVIGSNAAYFYLLYIVSGPLSDFLSRAINNRRRSPTDPR